MLASPPYTSTPPPLPLVRGRIGEIVASEYSRRQVHGPLAYNIPYVPTPPLPLVRGGSGEIVKATPDDVGDGDDGGKTAAVGGDGVEGKPAAGAPEEEKAEGGVLLLLFFVATVVSSRAMEFHRHYTAAPALSNRHCTRPSTVVDNNT